MTDDRSLLRVWGQPKMFALALLGFSSGLPLYLTGVTLQAWMTVEGVSLATVGAFSLVALPYSLKFLWAPLMDRYVPPFLGRRRGWLIVTQLLLFVVIAAMAFQSPTRGLQLLAINAILIAFFSASQDIVADAYRTDVLGEKERGPGGAIFILGYRIAMLMIGAASLMLAGQLGWNIVYLVLAFGMSVGIVATVLAPEPSTGVEPPKTLAQAVVLPFLEFFQRKGALKAILILVFIVVYKYPDNLVQNMSTPFLLKIGFTLTDVGAIRNGLGILATIVGVLIGGSLVTKLGINKSLWIFAVLQALSNFAYYVLAVTGADYPTLVGAILIENLCSGIAAAGFVAFLMSLCNVQFSATQFALLSSLVGASRDILIAPAGRWAEALGWTTFFAVTVVAALPGMLLLPFFAPLGRRESTADS